jgi:hypothetical protein
MKKTVCAFVISGEPEMRGQLFPEKCVITVECVMQPDMEGASLVTLRQPDSLCMTKDMAIGYLNRVLHAILSA